MAGYVSPYDATLTAVLSGGAWSTAFPRDNMLSLDIGDDGVARTLYASPSSTCWKAAFPIATPMGVMAAVNHNVTGLNPGLLEPSLPESRVRCIGRVGGGSLSMTPATFNPKSRPVAILASTNLTGSISLTQEADPEWSTSHMTATNPAADTDLRVSMQGATCGLQTGADLQTVRVFAFPTSFASPAPTVTLEVWLSGVQKWVSSPVAVTHPLGTLVTFTWNASVLGGAPPPADGVQLRVRGTASGGATIEPGSIEWLAEYASNSDATVVDLGWEEIALPPDFWTPPQILQNLYHIREFPEGTTCDEMFVEFAGVLNDGASMQIGKFWAGDAEEFVDAHENPTDWEEETLLIGPTDPSYIEVLPSGALDVERVKLVREASVTYKGLNEATAFGLIERRLNYYCGKTRPALWRFRPLASHDHRSTFLAVQTELNPVVPMAAGPAYRWSGALREWV